MVREWRKSLTNCLMSVPYGFFSRYAMITPFSAHSITRVGMSSSIVKPRKDMIFSWLSFDDIEISLEKD